MWRKIVLAGYLRMTSRVLSLLTPETAANFHRRGEWENRTIYSVLQDQVECKPDTWAVRDRGQSLTYAQLQAAADALAEDLYARGVRRFQRVAYWLPDCVESIIIVLACSRNGYVVCPSPHRNHTVREIVELLERMQAVAFVYQEGFGSDAATTNIKLELSRLSSLDHIFQIEPFKTTPLFAGAFLSHHSNSTLPVEDPDRVSYLAFTSGSTGQPKGVMHSDNTQLVTARGISRDWKIGPGSVVYSMSPLSHNLGMGAYLTALYGGATFVAHDRLGSESTVDRILEVEASYLVGVPTHALDLLNEMDARGMGRLGKVKGFRVSGAAAPKEVFERLLVAGVEPQSGYGMTETNGHQYTRPGDNLDLITGSCGRAVPGYAVRIFDPDDLDREMPQGKIGIVGGKGACLMLGYYNDQTATEKCLNSDGWFLTGDLGVLDTDGYLTLTGRIKEVIVRGGHNINPERIEGLAMRDPAVERAVALPVPDDRLGERVCLAVTFRAGAIPDFDSVLEHLASLGLSRYDMPEFMLALNDVPLMSNGKFQRKDIMDWIQNGTVSPLPVRYTPFTGGD